MKRKKDNAFILIEILVSLLLLTSGILFLIKSLSMITKSNQQLRNNRLAFILIDNIYNQLYSQEPIIPGKVILNNKEFFWDFTVNNTGDGLSQLSVNVQAGTEGNSSVATLDHSIIDIRK